MNGIIILDKPKGKTSHDMVYALRRLTGIKKIGHTGTLDPIATGVLPMCIGNATKTADMLTAQDKKYRAELVLGMTTDTGDAEGNVLTRCDTCLNDEEIQNAVMEFVGEIEQIPPMYSAVKQDGKKLYELARKGIEVERKPRRITITSIEIISIDTDEKRVVMDVECSKGTYIRTLCEDIGARLGVGGYMNNLRRLRSGNFDIGQSRTVEELCRMKEEGRLSEAVIKTEDVFDYKKIYLNEFLTGKVKNGVPIRRSNLEENRLYRVYGFDGEFLCVSRYTGGALKMEKSFWI